MKIGMIIAIMLVRFSMVRLAHCIAVFHTLLTIGACSSLVVGIGMVASTKGVPSRIPMPGDCVFASGKLKKDLGLF